MSASQDKKKRTAEREAGTEKRQVAAKESADKAKKTRRKWTFGTVVVVLLVALILIANSGLFYTVLPSVTVGGLKYTNAEYQYFYYGTYYNFVNTYSSYISYIGLDTSSPLSEQACAFSEGQTWAEYFRDGALNTMTSLSAVYSAAVADGYTLSEEDAAAIDASIADMTTAAESYGYSSAKNYISAVYGRGCTENTVRKLSEMQYIAAAYEADNEDAFTYTDDELKTWYEDNKDSYDKFDYLSYYVAADTVEETVDVTDDATGEVTQETKNVTTDETMAAAKETADAIAAELTDEDSFYAAVAKIIGGAETPAADETAEAPTADAENTTGDNTGDADTAEDAETVETAGDENAEETETVPEPTLAEGTSGSSLSDVYSEWMLDADREALDFTVAESENAGYYVVMFLVRDDNSYNTVSVRHILITAEDTDADGEISDEELAAAETKIGEIYDEWKAGDATEDSFAELANEYSKDTGSNTTGGLYEDIYKNAMVAEFNDWIFDESRKPGDTGVIYSSSTGYHLIYFVGEGVTYRDYLADSNLRSADYSEWYTSVTEGWEAKTNVVFKFASD